MSKKKKKRKKNILNYRKPARFNIGVLIFAVVLAYFLISFFRYLTETHISVYEVQTGRISQSAVYTGLILREEEVTYAEENGSVNYYMKEADKAGYGDLICSIDSEGSIASMITEAGLDASTLSTEELEDIDEIVDDFMSSWSNLQFYNVYSFKDNLNASVQENLYLAALESLSEETLSSDSFTLVTAQTDGVLAFYTDGYEYVTTENFTADMYNPSGYTKNRLNSSASVSSGQALYKTVTDEDWYLMIPIDEEETLEYEAMLSEGSTTFTIYVTFLKDDASCYATASLYTSDDGNFLQLAFNSSMVRYISERYLEVELGENDETGLKIPNSAITTKEYLLIPEEYITTLDNSSSKGVIKIVTDKNGDTNAEFISVTIYKTADEYCYVSQDDLSLGDILQLPDSSTLYTISETGSLQGVYNMNKGYAVFRLIDILSSNEEYTIVDTGTSYGLSLYDRIAADGSSVSEGDYLN